MIEHTGPPKVRFTGDTFFFEEDIPFPTFVLSGDSANGTNHYPI